MKRQRRLLVIAAPAFVGLLSTTVMGLAATPGPASPGGGLQTITGQVLNIEGDVYAVKDISGHEVLFHVTKETRVEGGLKLKVGDRIEAQVTPEGHAIVVALKLPDAGSLPAVKQKEERP